jgi:hypothetical protein
MDVIFGAISAEERRERLERREWEEGMSLAYRERENGESRFVSFRYV